jgi:multisubunit Na+/H+ antiporter MnhC subunit
MTQPTSGEEDGAPERALAAALAELVSDGTLAPAQATAVGRAFRERRRHGVTAAGDSGPVRSPWPLLLAEIGGYVGGAFVLGAATILLSDSWHLLGTPARVAALAVPALLLAGACVATARSTPGGWRARADREPAPGVAPRRRLVSVLISVAALLSGGAAAVVVDAEHASGDWAAFAFAWSTLLIAGAAYLACRAELLHTVLGMAAAAAALASLRVTGGYGERSTGWTFVAVGVGWGVATLRGLLAERGLGFGWSGVLVFVGAELLTAAEPATVGYAVLALLAAAGIAGFTWGRSLTALVIGVATLAVLVPQAVIDATGGTLTSSGALLLVGLSIVGASALGFRLHRTPRRS